MMITVVVIVIVIAMAMEGTIVGPLEAPGAQCLSERLTHSGAIKLSQPLWPTEGLECVDSL